MSEKVENAPVDKDTGDLPQTNVYHFQYITKRRGNCG